MRLSKSIPGGTKSRTTMATLYFSVARCSIMDTFEVRSEEVQDNQMRAQEQGRRLSWLSLDVDVAGEWAVLLGA